MTGDIWKKWYREQLHAPPASVARGVWVRDVLGLGTSRKVVDAFYDNLGGGSLLDGTRIRLGHLYLLGLGGDHPLAPRMNELLLRRMAYHVRHLRQWGACATPNYKLAFTTGCERQSGKGGSKERSVVGEEHFRQVLAVATKGLPEDISAALVAGMHLMYYCGIGSSNVVQLQWADLMDISGSIFVWSKGRLICLPPQVVRAIVVYKEMVTRKARAMFMPSIGRALTAYKALAATLPTLKTMRG